MMAELAGLHELPANGFDGGVFQFAGGHVIAGYLHGDFGDGNVGQERHGQRGVGDDADNHTSEENHQHGNRTLKKKFDHK